MRTLEGDSQSSRRGRWRSSGQWPWASRQRPPRKRDIPVFFFVANVNTRDQIQCFETILFFFFLFQADVSVFHWRAENVNTRDQIQCFETILFFCFRLTCQYFIGGKKMLCLCHNRIEVMLTGF